VLAGLHALAQTLVDPPLEQMRRREVDELVGCALQRGLNPAQRFRVTAKPMQEIGAKVALRFQGVFT
jgi:hypothetical protein